MLYALYDETIWSRLKISGYGYNYMPVSDGSMSSAEFAKQSETPQAMTFQELGAEIGIDGAVLLQTVADFNTMVDRGDDDAFGRDMGTADALRDAPFYALPIATATGKSFGGAALATDGAVLDRDSQPIEGLFAAGEVAGILGGGNLGEHLRIGVRDAGKVHHLAQADDARPGHGLGDVLGPQGDAGRLQPRRRGRAGRGPGRASSAAGCRHR